MSAAAPPSLPKPTVGRIVHYINDDGTHLAAIVIGVPHADYAVHLAVFAPMPGVVGGTTKFLSDIMGDFTQHQPDTWHWPEREERGA